MAKQFILKTLLVESGNERAIQAHVARDDWIPGGSDAGVRHWLRGLTGAAAPGIFDRLSMANGTGRAHRRRRREEGLRVDDELSKCVRVSEPFPNHAIGREKTMNSLFSFAVRNDHAKQANGIRIERLTGSNPGVDVAMTQANLDQAGGLIENEVNVRLSTPARHLRGLPAFDRHQVGGVDQITRHLRQRNGNTPARNAMAVDDEADVAARDFLSAQSNQRGYLVVGKFGRSLPLSERGPV